LTCNSRGGAGLIWKPYEEKCVLNCPTPYVTKTLEIDIDLNPPNPITGAQNIVLQNVSTCVIGSPTTNPNVTCGLNQFYPGTGSTCNTCDVTNCRRCVTSGVCIMCALGN